MGAFPVRLPQVSAADLSRVCQPLHPAVGVGQGLLPAPAPGREEESSRGSSVAGLQMDPDHLSLLERRQALRRAGIPELLAPAALSNRRLSGGSHRLDVETSSRFPKTLQK